MNNEAENLDRSLQKDYNYIIEAQKAVDKFTAGKIYLAGEFGGDWLLRAVSAKERQKWMERFVFDAKHKEIFERAFKSLAEAADKKISLCKPKAEDFAFRNPQEEEVMKASLKNLATLKIHQIGMRHDQWQGTDTPFKSGYIWAKDESEDHSYCRLYRFTVSREYSGGGKHEGDYKATLKERNLLVGCP